MAGPPPAQKKKLGSAVQGLAATTLPPNYQQDSYIPALQCLSMFTCMVSRYRIHCLGHSLGGGVAALAAYLLRTSPDLRDQLQAASGVMATGDSCCWLLLLLLLHGFGVAPGGNSHMNKTLAQAPCQATSRTSLHNATTHNTSLSYSPPSLSHAQALARPQ